MQMAILDQKYPQLLYNVINFGSLAFDQDPRNKNWMEGMLKLECAVKGSGEEMTQTISLFI